MFRTGTLLLVSLITVACGSDASGDSGEGGTMESRAGEPAVSPAYSFSDPDVTRVYQRMMSTIAPENGWERARYLEFDRGSPGGNVRRHRWDRWEGRARVEAEMEGGTMVALFETDRPAEGRVWLDGTEVMGEDAATLLAGAYRTHINDGYWLLMPFKWDDPGVTTRYLGSQEDEDGRQWEVVELAFDTGIGITPQNMYHAFVNMETGRMERWHHFANPEASPSPSEWTEWRRYGPIELAQNRRVDGEIRSHFPHLRVETSVPEGALDPPS